jgi:hypothetical protein
MAAPWQSLARVENGKGAPALPDQPQSSEPTDRPSNTGAEDRVHGLWRKPRAAHFGRDLAQARERQSQKVAALRPHQRVEFVQNDPT